MSPATRAGVGAFWTTCRLSSSTWSRQMMRLRITSAAVFKTTRSEEHTSELQSQSKLVCRLLLEKKNERTSCYLYPGRPGVLHATNIDDVLPTRSGLLPFTAITRSLDALASLRADYPSHSSTART